MESSLSLHQHEAQEESDNLIQPHDHLTEIEEEEKEMTTFMKYDVYSAAEKGEINLVIEQGKDSQSLLTPQRNTVLHIYLTSITHKDPEPETDEFVERILGFCPALLKQVNTKKETPLHIAARYGHASIVNQLIRHSKKDHSDHNQDHESHRAEEAKKMLRMTSKEGDTALHEAVRFQHLNVVKILIGEDCDFEHNANKSGETPLYMAIERGYNDIAEEIIERCDSPATAGPNDRNVLHAAIIRKDRGMIDYILNKMGEEMLKQGDQKGWTPLHYAASMGNLDAVKTFLTKEMGREAAYMKNTDGDTALHLATVSNNQETMLEIIKWCPDSSELVNNKGWNFFHAASISSDSALMKEILQSRTSLSNLINEKDGDGNTPLHIAMEELNLDVDFFFDDPRVDKLAFNNENKNAIDLYTRSTINHPGMGLYKFYLKMKGLRSGMRMHTDIKDSKQDKKNKILDELKKVQDANVIVAALIATVTFTAGFTVPGGFVSEKGRLEGTPMLGRNSAFKTFMVMDTIAMVLSTSSVLIHLFFNFNNEIRNIWYLAISSFVLTIAAMVAMVVAFATGTYAMLGYSISFSIVICVLALSFFILFSCFLYKCSRR